MIRSSEDNYSREHMASKGVVHRDKAVSKIGFQLLTLIRLALFAMAALTATVLAIAANESASG
jgi:hypothetical protein